jgi:ribonuclease HI
MSVGPFVLYCDGASRGNPGPSAIGAALFGPDGGEPIAVVSRRIEDTTNNVAEYRALEAGLERALELGVGRLVIRLDSQLLARQMTGTYRVRAPRLRPLAGRVAALIRRFESVTVEHVPRESNTVADDLANAALDSRAV